MRRRLNAGDVISSDGDIGDDEEDQEEVSYKRSNGFLYAYLCSCPTSSVI